RRRRQEAVRGRGHLLEGEAHRGRVTDLVGVGVVLDAVHDEAGLREFEGGRSRGDRDQGQDDRVVGLDAAREEGDADQGGDRGEPSEEAIQELARRYWRPIHAYIRMVGRRSDEDARDLTQDFFVFMMETDFAAKADPNRGRFRSFVKVALKHYLGEEARAEGRL